MKLLTGNRGWAAIALAVALGCVTLAATPTAAVAGDDKATADEVRDLIRSLGADDPDVREKATERLVAIGRPALEALREAAESPDFEVRWRAKEALSQIEGTPESPEDAPRTRARGPDGTEDPNGAMPGVPEMEELLKGVPGLEEAFGESMKEAFEELRRAMGGEQPPQGDPNRPRVRIFQGGGQGGEWQLREVSPGASSLGDLGMEVQRVPAALRAHLSVPPGGGLLVTKVKKDGLAASIGVKRYDVIFGLDDEIVRKAADLDPIVDPKKKMVLRVIRKASAIEIEIGGPPTTEPETPDEGPK